MVVNVRRAIEKMSQIHLSTSNTSKSIHSFIHSFGRYWWSSWGCKELPGLQVFTQVIPLPFYLNEASCVQWNDLGQLILSQTHSARQCPLGMATQTNYFRQRNYTNAFCGPRAELGVGGGISSPYGTPKGNKGKLVFPLPQPAPPRVQATGVHKLL